MPDPLTSALSRGQREQENGLSAWGLLRAHGLRRALTPIFAGAYNPNSVKTKAIVCAVGRQDAGAVFGSLRLRRDPLPRATPARH